MNSQMEKVIEHILPSITFESLVIFEDSAEIDQHETKIELVMFKEKD